ncbi:putative nucleic acid-binding Zn-ribbon protein [Bradyrhizobium sp. GM22.5]
MKNLQLKRLLLLSGREKAAQLVTFDPSRTVVLGENDTGKSCLIKSIYAAFGADAAKVNPTWKDASVDTLVEFTVDGVPYSLLRSGSTFGLFDGDGATVWVGSNITSGIGPQIAKLLDFGLTLPDRKSQLQVPPPAFLFLPFYIDQDVSWVDNWSSFANLQMFAGYRKDVANFHAGLRPNEYYESKALKASADKAKEEFKVERRALDRASTRLRANRKRLHFDLSPEQFVGQIDALVAECRSLQSGQDKVQRALAELNSRRAILVEQAVIAENALADLSADYEFLRRETEDEIICPTCGTVHANDFANKFGLISDVDTCRAFLVDVRKEIETVDLETAAQKEQLGTFANSIARINSILDEQRGDLKLRDLIEGESEKLMDGAIASEQKEIDAEIGTQEMKSDEAAQTMKSLDDKKRQAEIKGFYLRQMNSFVQQLHVPNLSEESYKAIDCHIRETGSDLPRGLLAYYYAFIHTMKRFSTSAFCPIVVDTPVQQDQDAANAARMISFCLGEVPQGSQLILGTVSLHGVKYDGHVIETDTKNKLLKAALFEEVSALMRPYYTKLLQ